MSHEVWRETESGEVWAVQVEGGHIVGCRGPLRRSEIQPRWQRGDDFSDDAPPAENHRQDLETLTDDDIVVLAGSAE